jgi:subtilase family serine protease
MRNRLGSATAALAALATILAACSGGGGHSTVPATSGGEGSGLPAPQSVPGTIPYGAGTVAGAAFVGRAHLATVGLDVHVALSNQAGLYQYAREANDPKSALYRRWLTPRQLGDRFGASLATYQAMTKAYLAAGITVKTYPQRTMLRLSGPQAAVEKMLGVTFGIYRKNKQTFLAPEGAPHPPEFATNIAALTGAVGYVARGRNYVRASNRYNNGYAPQQVAAAFDYAGAYAAGYTGAGINVGIIGTGPITDDDPRFSACASPPDCGDVADFKKVYGVPGTGTVTQVFATDANLPDIPGENTTGLASPPPATDPNSSACTSQTTPDYTTCNPEDGEAQLDTEQVASLAYDANVLFYIAYNPNECASSPPCSSGAPEIGISLTDDEIQQAIADDTADILAMSFGLDETDSQSTYFPSGTTGPGPTEFAMAASEGMAVFASSGDSGAQGCSTQTTVDPALCVSYPATDPNVVSVGGVNAPIDQSGRLIGPLTAWGTQTGSQTSFQGTGGGCSLFFPLLSYEVGIAGETCTMRSQPDASLVADTNTGVAVDIDSAPTLGGREIEPVGGTSVAAPEMAAMWALVLQACKQNAACAAKGSGATPYRLGNPNAYFYTIYTSGSNGVAYANAFADVQYGDNTLVSPAPAASATPGPGFTATPGYDLTTGLGVPYARNLIKAVVGV